MVDQFGRNIAQYKSSAYDEASLRQEFLNPLFRSLGWDIENKAGLIPQHREVEIESRTEIAGRQKRADYLFRTDRQDRFICEAKKPAENLTAPYAFQAKRYTWNKGLVLAVLTDFEEMRVYVVGSRPNPGESDVGLWKTWRYQQYPLIAQEMWELLARPSVAAGSIEKLVDQLPRRPTGKGKARQQWLFKPDRSRALDADFLNFLDDARRDLASDLIRHNDRADLLQADRLNEASQRILDRLLFLRICEDRDIDTGRPLAQILQTWRNKSDHPIPPRPRQIHLPLREDGAGYATQSKPEAGGALWRNIVAHFRALDRRPPSHIPFFNGNLFKPHFSEELEVSDGWIAGFLDDVGDEESPYLFNIIPVEILGTIYERFLGKVVRPHGRGVVIEEKPEVRKAGGVYYTPRYIVDYLVEQTVGTLLVGQKPEATLKLRVLDPACGSGSFLIRAFERICEHWQTVLTKSPKERHRSDCWTDPETGDVHLTSNLKRRILSSNIYGVDIDSGAVEVTQLSLYLKMLEGENRTTIARERDLFGNDDALLPSLEGNVKCGNSLIAANFSTVAEDLIRVRAFNWSVNFHEIMKTGGFDAVIGNPPYIRIQTLQESDPQSVSYLNEHYLAAAKGNYDLYVVFVERALSLLNDTGKFGYILPHKFFNAKYGEALRELLAQGKHVSGIVHFGDQQVFEGATTYTCLLFLSKRETKTFSFMAVRNLTEWRSGNGFSKTELPSSKLLQAAWTFSASPNAALLERIGASNRKLADYADRIFQGLVTGADPVFLLEERGKGLFYSEAIKREVQLEPDLLHPLCKGSVNVRRYEIADVSKSILFPYRIEDGKAVLLTSTELAKKHPKCWGYLVENRKALEARERGKWRHDKWYAFGRSQNLSEMEQEKILTPSLAKKASFTHDSCGAYYFIGSGGGGGGGYGITQKSSTKENYRYLVGLLNSRLLDEILKSISSPFMSGYYAYNRQYIEQLPIRVIDFTDASDRARHDRLVALVDKMLMLTPKLRSAHSDSERATLQNAITATDQQINALVYDLYGLTREEIELVEQVPSKLESHARALDVWAPG